MHDSCRVRFCGIGLVLISAVLGWSGITWAAPFAYIPTLKDDGIWVIDTATDEVTAVIPPDAPIEDGADSEAPRAYVPSANDIWVVDTTTQMPMAKFAAGGSIFAVSPNEDRLYVVNSRNNLQQAPGSVSVLDATSGAEIARVQVGDFPFGIAVSADGRRVFVVNTSDLSEHPPCDLYAGFDCNLPLSIIDTETNADASPIIYVVGGNPRGVATDQNGFVYIAHTLYDEFDIYNRPYQREFPGLLVLDQRGQLIRDIRVGDFGGAAEVAVKRDGTRAYVFSDDGIAVVDPVRAEVVANIDTAGGGIALNPAETRAYVVARADALHPDDEVIVIDTATNTIRKHIPVGPQPVAFGQFIWPRAEQAAATPTPEASYTPIASPTDLGFLTETPTPTTSATATHSPTATASATPATPMVATSTPSPTSAARSTSSGCAMAGSRHGGRGSFVIVLLIGLIWRAGNRPRRRC